MRRTNVFFETNQLAQVSYFVVSDSMAWAFFHCSGNRLPFGRKYESAALAHDLHLQNIGAARGAQRQTAGDDHQIAVLHQIDLLGAIGGVDEQVVGGLLIMSESVPLVGKKSTVQTLEVAPHERRIPIL